MIAKTILNKLGFNRDSEKQARIIQAQFNESSDVQDVELFKLAGLDFIPEAGSKLFIVQDSSAYKIAIAVQDSVVVDGLEAGEICIYSAISKAVKGFIKILKTGKIQINGTGDNLVKYKQLQVAFDQLKSELDDLATKYNAHTHGGLVGIPTDQALASVADITLAKIIDIEVKA